MVLMVVVLALTTRVPWCAQAIDGHHGISSLDRLKTPAKPSVMYSFLLNLSLHSRVAVSMGVCGRPRNVLIARRAKPLLLPQKPTNPTACLSLYRPE